MSAIKPFLSMPGPRSFPLVGTLPRYLPLVGEYSFERLHRNGARKRERFGDAVREQVVPGVDVVWLFSPSDIRTMLEEAEGTYPCRRSHLALAHYRLSKPDVYSSAGLLPTNGAEWSSLRRRFQFRSSAVDAALPRLDALARDFATLAAANGAEDMLGCLKRYFFEATNVFLFGSPFEGLASNVPSRETVEFMEAPAKTNENVLKTDNGPMLWKHFQTPAYRRLREGQESTERFARLMLSRHGFQLASSVTEGAEERDLFTFVSDMLLAGMETSAYSMSFLLYHLSMNSKEQQLLREDECGKEPEPGLKRHRRCKMALKESLRLNPISVGVGRISQKDAVFSGYHVPAGTVLVSQNQVSCRLPQYFGRPNEFLPARWDREKQDSDVSGLARTPELVLPFGGGRRACIGRRLAEASVLLALNRLLAEVELEWDGKKELDCVSKLINRPDAPLRFKITRIS